MYGFISYAVGCGTFGSDNFRPWRQRCGVIHLGDLTRTPVKRVFVADVG